MESLGQEAGRVPPRDGDLRGAESKMDEKVGSAGEMAYHIF